MKNIYIFFIFLVLCGCGVNLTSNSKDIAVLCPSILFSSDDKVYIDSSADDISLENIEYKAEINNALFLNGCMNKNKIFSSEISILFILNPEVNSVNYFDMPFYIALLNEKKEMQDILYFSASGQFKKNPQTKISVESEITKKLTLNHKGINEKSIIMIGYMLDVKRYEILN